MSRKGKLIVITGPSGVGKSTIVREALERTAAAYSVSATTRRPRDGERDGRDYHFVDRPTFQAMIEQGRMLEWAEVFGELYGTPAGPVREALASGRAMVLEIDVQGGRQVAEKMPEAEFVLIEAPSEAELAKRLELRGSEDAAAAARRLAEAKAEVSAAKASGVYNHHVVNDDLETAIRQVVRIVNEESPRQ